MQANGRSHVEHVCATRCLPKLQIKAPPLYIFIFWIGFSAHSDHFYFLFALGRTIFLAVWPSADHFLVLFGLAATILVVI